jgi:hypothetical protein
MAGCELASAVPKRSAFRDLVSSFFVIQLYRDERKRKAGWGICPDIVAFAPRKGRMAQF